MCMCCSAIASAQIQLEYYWDTDPGYGKAIALPVSTDADETGTYTVTFEASTAGLTAGLHKLGMRALSAEYWSPTIFGYVMIARGNVYADRVEYFWDTDPGYGRATQVSIATGDDPTTVSFDIDVDGLSEGVHTLGLRSYALGWSPTVQYLVRIEGGEPVLIDAIEYYWDTDGFPAFGEARQVSFTPGTTVELTDWVIPTEGMTGDRILYIRAHSKGGWSPFVEHTISFSAEGNYTLDEMLAVGTARNFRSLSEMFADFSSRGATSDITVTVRNGATFAYDASVEANLAMVQAVVDDMQEWGGRITFAAASGATLNLTCGTAEQLQVLQAFATHVNLQNVTLNINGASYDFSMLEVSREDICSGSTSTPRQWSTISSELTIAWTAVPTSKRYVKGYIAEGTGDLPAMTLTNTGADYDQIDYHVTIAKDGTELRTFVYSIRVAPSIAAKTVNFTSPTPADAAVVDPGTATVTWSAVSGATSYEVTVESIAADGTVESIVTEQTATSVKITVATGYSYIYKVRAIGPCDNTAESQRSFTAFHANADDVAALRMLYDACGGTGWSKQWLFDAEVMKSTNYPGVTFNAEGRVTAINVTAYGLTGTLPTEALNLPALTTLNLSRNQLKGALPASMLTPCTALKTLNLSYNQLTAVDEALPTSITSLDLGYQHRVYGASSQLHDLAPLGTVEMALAATYGQDWGQSTLMKYAHSAQNWSATPTYELRSATLGNTYARLTYSGGYYHLTSLDYRQPQGAELIMAQTSGTANGSVQPVRVTFVEADANVDQVVDVRDVQHTLNYVVAAKGAEGLFCWSAANTFVDALINIQDVVVTVNHVLDHTNTVAQARARRMTAVERAHAHGRLYVEDGYLCLTADTAVAALDIELQGASATQVRLMLPAADWQMASRATDEGVRLVVFSPSGKTLPVGTTKLLALRAEKVSPIAADAADAHARSLTIGVEGGNATGLDAAQLTEALTAHMEDGTLYVESNVECEAVTLSLYDPAGRLIVQYADATLHTGDNTWPVEQARQGVYLLQVRMANGTTDVIRIAAK